MASTVQALTKKGKLNPPPFIVSNVHYEVVTGSIAYGVNTPDSDWDVAGFCVPPKDTIFPHLKGHIAGFDDTNPFNQWESEKVIDPDNQREYEFKIYGIVRYFRLCLENNPNMLDTLFVPRECILFSTAVGEMVREGRNLFVHKGCWPRLKGYAYSQLSAMKREPQGKRKAIVERYSFDVKFAYHVIRLLDQAEQLLATGDMDLRRAKEQMKAIRRGEVSEHEIREWAAAKERNLEELYHKSTLPWGRHDVEPHVKRLLMDCLEQHYGSLEKCVGEEKLAEKTIGEIELAVQRYRERSK